MRFIVTGPMRSGTTFMASILNSQDNILCVEDYPWKDLGRPIHYQEEFDCLCAQVEAKYIYLGLEPPPLRQVISSQSIIEDYCKHLQKNFTCEILGFKKTMMSTKEIGSRIRDGYKVILMKRETNDILESMLRRIDPSIERSSMRLLRYLKSINFYNLPRELTNHVLIVNYNELIQEKQLSLRRVQDFLGTDIVEPKILYHSFNKGRFFFNNNSSFPDSSSDQCKTLRSRLPSRHTKAKIKLVAAKIERNSIAIPINYFRYMANHIFQKKTKDKLFS